MKIHELEYLPVRNVALRQPLGKWRPSDVCFVSLYGHWCHMRYADNVVVSVPASAVVNIEWAA